MTGGSDELVFRTHLLRQFGLSLFQLGDIGGNDDPIDAVYQSRLDVDGLESSP